MELKKFKLTFDKDWEQNWLNEMCQQGWAFKSFSFGVYTFETCQPGEFIYQVDLMPGSGVQASDPDGYAEFMAETGVEVVARWFRWIILRKRAEDGPFEIYTDAESQIASYKSIRMMLCWGLMLELLCSAPTFRQLLSNDFDPAINIFLCVVSVFFICIFAGFVAGILKYTRRIQELEQQQ